MNDISITLPISSHHSQSRTSSAKGCVNWFRTIAAGLGAASAAYGLAASQAYVTPFQTPAKGKAPDLDDLTDGRDPNW